MAEPEVDRPQFAQARRRANHAPRWLLAAILVFGVLITPLWIVALVWMAAAIARWLAL